MKKIKESPIEYYGYLFYEDGKVVSPSGQVLMPNVDKNGNRSILMSIHDESSDVVKKRRVYIARTLYNLFYDVTLPSNMIIKYIDGDKGNYGLNNLIAVKKAGTPQKPILTSEQASEIRKLYSNKDKHFHSQWKKTENDYSVRDLSRMYNVSINTIQRVLNGSFDRNARKEN